VDEEGFLIPEKVQDLTWANYISVYRITEIILKLTHKKEAWTKPYPPSWP
jgi:hypothetical protein